MNCYFRKCGLLASAAMLLIVDVFAAKSGEYALLSPTVRESQLKGMLAMVDSRPELWKPIGDQLTQETDCTVCNSTAWLLKKRITVAGAVPSPEEWECLALLAAPAAGRTQCPRGFVLDDMTALTKAGFHPPQTVLDSITAWLFQETMVCENTSKLLKSIVMGSSEATPIQAWECLATLTAPVDGRSSTSRWLVLGDVLDLIANRHLPPTTVLDSINAWLAQEFGNEVYYRASDLLQRIIMGAEGALASQAWDCLATLTASVKGRTPCARMSVLDKMIALVKAGHQPPQAVLGSIFNLLQDPAMSTSASRFLQATSGK